MQGGNEYILYLKLDSNLIKEYEQEFYLKQVEPHKDISDNKFYMNTPYSDKRLDDDFNIYYLDTDCDNSGYCNHGLNNILLSII